MTFSQFKFQQQHQAKLSVLSIAVKPFMQSHYKLSKAFVCNPPGFEWLNCRLVISADIIELSHLIKSVIIY